jgi:hypothetical protein
MRLARTDRQLVHPIGGLEGYSPTEVRFAQMRTREASRPRAVAHYLSIHG